MLTVDGSEGEGGGQVLRTSLALSLVTGTPFSMENIRAGRAKPGLMRQHLTAVNAAAAVGDALVEGAEVGSKRISFTPRGIKAGHHTFSVGTAGSATLVLQTVLPALILQDTPSFLTLEGGTHNPMAPPFEFLAHVFLPVLERMGPKVTCDLKRHGFFPAGGGRFTASIQPVKQLAKVELMHRGAVVRQDARVLLAKVPWSVGEREMAVLQARLGWPAGTMAVEEVARPHGPGNVIMAHVEHEHTSELFTAFGERGVRAEDVANTVADEVLAWSRSEVPVGEHLADQLMLPMALAGGGAFVTGPLSSHARTQALLIPRFLGVRVETTETAAGSVLVRILAA